MTLATFSPPMTPSVGLSNDPEVKLLKADFGDGYTQYTRDGMNNVRNVYSLSWDVLTKDEAVAITGFFVGLGGSDPFYWTPPDDVQQKFTCEKWTDKRITSGFRSVTATFRQDFNLAT